MPTKEEVQQIIQAHRLYMGAYGLKLVGKHEEAASFSEQLEKLDPSGDLQQIFGEMLPVDQSGKEKEWAEMGMRIGLAIRDQVAKGRDLK